MNNFSIHIFLHFLCMFNFIFVCAALFILPLSSFVFSCPHLSSIVLYFLLCCMIFFFLYYLFLTSFCPRYLSVYSYPSLSPYPPFVSYCPYSISFPHIFLPYPVLSVLSSWCRPVLFILCLFMSLMNLVSNLFYYFFIILFQDIPPLVEDLDNAGVRFVHFSEENEIKSRVRTTLVP